MKCTRRKVESISIWHLFGINLYRFHSGRSFGVNYGRNETSIEQEPDKLRSRDTHMQFRIYNPVEALHRPKSIFNRFIQRLRIFFFYLSRFRPFTVSSVTLGFLPPFFPFVSRQMTANFYSSDCICNSHAKLLLLVASFARLWCLSRFFWTSFIFWSVNTFQLMSLESVSGIIKILRQNDRNEEYNIQKCIDFLSLNNHR